MKECSHCHSIKEEALFRFHPHTKSNLQSWCKECQNKSQNELYPSIKGRVALYSKEYSKKLKYEVFSTICGGNIRCMCDGCSETKIEFMSIDHINQDGYIHRRKEHISSGGHTYLWIKKNGYPPGFRVLCYNCNLALGFLGYCPHNSKCH